MLAGCFAQKSSLGLDGVLWGRGQAGVWGSAAFQGPWERTPRWTPGSVVRGRGWGGSVGRPQRQGPHRKEGGIWRKSHLAEVET